MHARDCLIHATEVEPDIAPGAKVEYTVSDALVSYSTTATQCISAVVRMHIQYLLCERKSPCGTNDCK